MFINYEAFKKRMSEDPTISPHEAHRLVLIAMITNEYQEEFPTKVVSWTAAVEDVAIGDGMRRPN